MICLFAAGLSYQSYKLSYAIFRPIAGAVSKAGCYLPELINGILDLAVIESGKLSLSR
ncbi:MAG: hypothetical protein ACXV8O_20485 [Methylobacter sp.]